MSQGRTLLLALVALAAVTAVATAASSGRDAASRARAVLINQKGKPIGLVTMRARHGKVFVTGRVSGITPGFHGFHVHAVGKCDPNATDASGTPTPFSSAGGHVNPGGKNHGAHAGDVPPLLVNADGTASTTFPTDRFSIRSLLDADGSAVIVHADNDNLANIPQRYQSSQSTTPGPDALTLATGDSGGRVACGVLRRR